MKKRKLRVGWFSFTCCEDSTIVMTELMNERWQEWKDKIEFVYARILQSFNELKDIDVSFVEGAIGRLFPDQIVSCGPSSAVVPYTDPGLPLARKINEVIDEYIETYNETPKMIVMQNHGMIALGKTPHEVMAITAMALKAARVLQGAYAFGGPHFMTPENVARIHTRPDEQYRRKRI